MWYSAGMFNVTQETNGQRGAFVKLVQSDSEDYAVIVRTPEDGRLHQRYIGPDQAKAEEVFAVESNRLLSF